ncbi:protein FAR-RED ELONGATED HYPOCOTYL 3-like [Carya illinoinensis]|uniref:protein FAR-RED ELONGATED HYPOCOTYL 3-like n=1 Tax=Carya illinoinensis TaxID=32201 RepID=UPI001C71E419|nr:protein FAR-RED ELONGATED HYPOCOTYL 3-like [Carya illinoinensis]
MASIRANKSYGSLVVGVGGFENLPFLKKDCRNYIDKSRHLRLGASGARALRQYFLRMQYKNPGFFYMMDIDDDGRLKNVFWADPRSRAAYQYFGDVVTFDTTYLTNRYGMPFAPFVGVNHHGQSILLGAGLISSEDIETFVWLFETWLQCMDGNTPKSIIIDQDRAMKNAIRIVFPNTRHRFCLWHILKKVPEKLGSYGLFLGWNEYHAAKREHECIFDGYVHSRTNLKEFVDQFDNVLKKKIENENLANFHSFNVTISCISRSLIEKRFQELYTIAKFKEAQQQVNGIIDLNPKLHNYVGAVKTYMVDDEVCLEEFTKLIKYFVEFSEIDAVAKCSCGLFEMRGILCQHILAVFRCNDIKYLPKMITHTVGLSKHTEDAMTKLEAMIELYRANEEPPSMTQIGSNVDSTANATTIGGTGEVHSSRVVKGKCRPPSLRRASKMKIDMRKAKVKTKKAPAKGKRKEREGVHTRVTERENTPIVEVCRNLFGTSKLDVSNMQPMAERESTASALFETQPQEIVLQSQKSVSDPASFSSL